MANIGGKDGSSLPRRLRFLDSALPGATVFLPLLNYILALRQVDLWNYGFGQEVVRGIEWPSEAYIAFPLVLLVIWYGTSRGYLWGFAAHALVGLSLLNEKMLNLLFGVRLYDPDFAMDFRPGYGWGTCNTGLAIAFAVVSAYCLFRAFF